MKNPFKTNSQKFSDVPNQSAGILDDFGVRKVIATQEGSIERIPTQNNHITNKLYVDTAISSATIFVPYTGATKDLNLGNNDIFLNSTLSKPTQIELRDNRGGQYEGWTIWHNGASFSPLTIYAATGKRLELNYTTGNVEASHYSSNVATGTAPLSVSSSTICTNLNADLLDGKHNTDFIASDNANFATLTNDSMADTLHRHSELSASDGSPNPALSVDASGNVGIGITNPRSSLDVNGDLYVESANGRIWGINGLASGHTIHFQYGGDNNNEITTTWGSQANMKAYHGMAFSNNTGTTAKIGINNGVLDSAFYGKVGFPTETPLAPVHAGKTITDYGSIDLTNTGAVIASQTNTQDAARSNVLTLMRTGVNGVRYAGAATFDLSKYESSGVWARTQLDISLAHTSTQDLINLMTLRSDGNVGVGTTSPNTKLEVVGTISGSNIFSSGGYTGVVNLSGATLKISGGLIIGVT